MEELIIYVRYIKNQAINETFLSIVPLESATTEGYVTTMEKELDKLGLLQSIFTNKKLIGIGTDGAANMICAENGLVPKVQQQVAHVIGVHCIAHRLNLCSIFCQKCEVHAGP